jgi:hypothetical protein
MRIGSGSFVAWPGRALPGSPAAGSGPEARPGATLPATGPGGERPTQPVFPIVVAPRARLAESRAADALYRARPAAPAFPAGSMVRIAV